MYVDEAEEDRRWQRIATQWRADESSIRAPKNTVKLALQAAALRRESASAAGPLRMRVAAVALLAVGIGVWLLPGSDRIPEKAAPALEAHPTFSDPWQDEPCSLYSSCVDAYAELAYLELPNSRGS